MSASSSSRTGPGPGDLAARAVDPWLYFTADEFNTIAVGDGNPGVDPASRWAPGACDVCLEPLPLGQLCQFHSCGARACSGCLVEHINSSVSETNQAPFPPRVLCACRGGDLLLPDPRSPVVTFLGSRWAEWYAQLHRARALRRSRGNQEAAAEAARAIAPVANALRLRRCPGCSQYVDFAGGCLDIFCVCGARFCFACGQPTPWNSECGCGGLLDFGEGSGAGNARLPPRLQQQQQQQPQPQHQHQHEHQRHQQQQRQQQQEQGSSEDSSEDGGVALSPQWQE
ncbi:hypothetical protein QBC38DRAFT_450906 [Podospora fimiseda]|uniref:IBR domain-containing protein n=1 Tax=Podospora fimiseda TaxID=252190 RepID=A0AAN7H421_9PEZI|nr:hypothetical protein QBC38DRAFT_450906 [Podospora fimiseda]